MVRVVEVGDREGSRREAPVKVRTVTFWEDARAVPTGWFLLDLLSCLWKCCVERTVYTRINRFSDVLFAILGSDEADKTAPLLSYPRCISN